MLVLVCNQCDVATNVIDIRKLFLFTQPIKQVYCLDSEALFKFLFEWLFYVIRLWKKTRAIGTHFLSPTPSSKHTKTTYK